MFKRLFSLFRHSDETKSKPVPPPAQQAPATPGPVAPGTELSYDPSLVEHLMADHKKLLGLYGEIAASLEQQDYEAIHQQLQTFTSMLRGHLLTENIKLYVYLSHNLATDPENLELMTELRREMGHIGRKVNQFLTRYAEWPWTSELRQSFPGEFQRIGEVLGDRIGREEDTLYTLYLPPGAYSTGIPAE